MITTTMVLAGSAPSPREEEASSDAGALRWAGLLGVGFVVLVAASVLIEGGRPDTFATDAEITRFFGAQASQTRGVIAAFLLIPAALLFLWFLGGLYGRLRPTDRQSGQLSAAVALGGGFFVTFLVAAKLIDNITAASLAFSHTYSISFQEARITAGLAYWVQGASMAGASALLVAASILACRARQVPSWAAVAGYVLAAVGPASVALNGVPILLFFVWIVAAGIVLARGSAASRGTHRVSRERRAAHGP
jgi:hypothetical protein